MELPEAVIDVMVSLRTWLQARPAFPPRSCPHLAGLCRLPPVVLAQAGSPGRKSPNSRWGWYAPSSLCWASWD